MAITGLEYEKHNVNMKYLVKTWRFGLIQNLSLEQWLNQVEQENPGYEVFDVLVGTYWAPGGGESWREIILIKK